MFLLVSLDVCSLHAFCHEDKIIKKSYEIDNFDLFILLLLIRTIIIG